MTIEMTWLGHACWQIDTATHTILVDPFLDSSPVSPRKAAEIDADFVLVTHGHVDHMADAAAVAARSTATLIANYEIAEWFAAKHKVENRIGMNIGGAVRLPFGVVKMTPALHSSVLPDGTYGGNPGGFLITIGDKRIYIAGDTALFSDMQLIGKVGIELAILPIGDLFTMGPEDSIEAIRLISPRKVAPSHYNTWPPIAQNGDAWAERVRAETSASPIVLNPGGSFSI